VEQLSITTIAQAEQGMAGTIAFLRVEHRRAIVPYVARFLLDDLWRTKMVKLGIGNRAICAPRSAFGIALSMGLLAGCAISTGMGLKSDAL